MNRDEEHLRLLRIFHYVCAGMAALIACVPLFHLVFGLLMVFAPNVFGKGNQQPPVLLGWIFVVLAGGFILLGWTFAALLAWAGRCLGRRTHYTYCFVLACISCAFMPFGTVLGVFTIMVLTRPSVKALFEESSAMRPAV